MLDTEIKLYPTTGGGYTVAYTHPFTKRRIRQTFETKGSAQSRHGELTEELSKTISDRPGEMLISDLLILFLKEWPKNEFYRKRWLFEDFSSSFGKFRLFEVTTDALRIWLSQIEIEKGYKSATMFGLRVDVNIFFRYLISKGIIQGTPTAGIIYENRLPESKKKRVLIPKPEIEDLVQKSKDYSPGYFYPIFRMFVETAAKTDEIIELKWEDLNFKVGTVIFPEREKIASRSILLSKDLLKALERTKPIAEVIFPHIAGKKFLKKQLTIALLDFKRDCKIDKPWMYLDLRHSYAWNFLKGGGGMRELMVNLGHRSIHTTREMYGEYLKAILTHRSPFEADASQ